MSSLVNAQNRSLIWLEYHAVTSLADGSPIEFDVNASGKDYIDFATTLLYVRAKLTGADGANLAADEAVGLVSLLLHRMFSQLYISLNGTLITSSTNTYTYRAMLETLLNYGEDNKTSQLTSALYCEDQAGTMDSTYFDDNAVLRNAGLVKRRAFVCKSESRV